MSNRQDEPDIALNAFFHSLTRSSNGQVEQLHESLSTGTPASKFPFALPDFSTRWTHNTHAGTVCQLDHTPRRRDSTPTTLDRASSQGQAGEVIPSRTSGHDSNGGRDLYSAWDNRILVSDIKLKTLFDGPAQKSLASSAAPRARLRDKSANHSNNDHGPIEVPRTLLDAAQHTYISSSSEGDSDCGDTRSQIGGWSSAKNVARVPSLPSPYKAHTLPSSYKRVRFSLKEKMKRMRSTAWNSTLSSMHEDTASEYPTNFILGRRRASMKMKTHPRSSTPPPAEATIEASARPAVSGGVTATLSKGSQQSLPIRSDQAVVQGPTSDSTVRPMSDPCARSSGSFRHEQMQIHTRLEEINQAIMLLVSEQGILMKRLGVCARAVSS